MQSKTAVSILFLPWCETPTVIKVLTSFKYCSMQGKKSEQANEKVLKGVPQNKLIFSKAIA